MILLTDEGIKQLVEKWSFEDRCTDYLLALWAAKAQLKKVVEWGEEDCSHTDEELGILCVEETGRPDKKRECDLCWQALLEEVKG